MASILNRASAASSRLRSSVSQAPSLNQLLNCNRASLYHLSAQLDYFPLYSVANSDCQRQQQQQPGKIHQSIRWANTTSGIYAPTTLTSNQRATSLNEPHGNLSVFEDSDHLPSLPVPPLSETLERLKESVSPIAMNSAEFVSTLQLIDKFAESAGPKLDLLVKNKASSTKNWLTRDWWTEQTYLRSRQPLVINSNPAMIYPAFPFEVDNQRALINVVSQLISGIIDFKLSLIHGYNPEAVNSDSETRLDPNICYHQYRSIFGSTRLPAEHIDTQRVKRLVANGSENEAFNIIISFKGRFFEIQLRNIEDEKDRIDKLTGILDKIVVSSMHNLESHHRQEGAATNVTHNNNQVDGSNAAGAGVLTTAGRGTWAKAYRLLDEDSMSAIQEAQFVVCLDTIPHEEDGYPSDLLHYPAGGDQHTAALGRQILHGDLANVGNRWFDKAFQLIVVADENAEKLLGAGINYEHSFGEGTLVTKIIEYSFDKTVQKNRESSRGDNFFGRQQVAAGEPATFRQLRMFNPETMEAVSSYMDQAKQDFSAQVSQFDLWHLRYKNYGSNAIKSWHFSPDSWFQVALQLAYFNLHHRLGPCYESASTRRFAYGRTETIRSLTTEVAQFCHEPRFDTLQSAIHSHKAYANSACNGEAIDRILLGYRMTFNELRANNWSWGLPALNEDTEGLISKQLLDKSLMKDDLSTSGSDGGVQKFSIDDLFTEDELSTLSSFFNSELINRSTKFALSTSLVPSVHPNICMSYGPLLADGYGCCYNITGQQIVASITANSSNQSFSCEVEKLSSAVTESLNKMRDIVEEQRSRSN